MRHKHLETAYSQIGLLSEILRFGLGHTTVLRELVASYLLFCERWSPHCIASVISLNSTMATERTNVSSDLVWLLTRMSYIRYCTVPSRNNEEAEANTERLFDRQPELLSGQAQERWRYPIVS